MGMTKSLLQLKRISYIALAACVLAAPASAQRLDDNTTAGYINYLGSLLGLNFSEAERAEIRTHVSGYWTANDRVSKKTVVDSAVHWNDIQQRPPDLVATAMTMSRPDALLGLHKAAQEGAADSQYLLNIYYRKNPAIAPAKPGGLPLTREMVEADLALKLWLANEIHQQNAPAPNARVKDAAVRAAIQAHPTLTAEQQVKLARQPGEWARISYAWPRASAIDKLLTRADMGARLTSQEQAAVQQVIAGFNAQLSGMVSQHRNAMFNSAIQNMKENSDTIMGRGTIWNPSTNRWEQQGGIVTEYNGTVRVP